MCSESSSNAVKQRVNASIMGKKQQRCNTDPLQLVYYVTKHTGNCVKVYYKGHILVEMMRTRRLESRSMNE